jgi:hypothetical protein
VNRTKFGAWGADLSDAEFAKAFAIAGIHSVFHWPVFGDAAAIAARLSEKLTDPQAPIPCRYFLARPEEWTGYQGTWGSRVARDLAEAWDLLQPTIHWQPRFELHLDPLTRGDDDPTGAGWIVDQLRNPALNACSVYIDERPLIQSVDWHWPVRIGLLTEDAKQAHASASCSFAVEYLTTPVDVVREQGAVDLLWIAGAVADALQTIEDAPYPVHANAVAITGGDGGLSWLSLEQARQRIVELTQAEAVVVTRVEPANWIESLITELSHDFTFDVAVSRSGGHLLSVASGPLLWSSEPLIRDSRISSFSRGLVQRGLSQVDPGRELILDEHTAGQLNLPSGANPAGPVLERLGDRIQDIGWMRESFGASVASGVHRAIQRSLRASAARPLVLTQARQSSALPSPAPRHLQVAAFAEDKRFPKKTQLEDVFAAGFQHTIEVHIGPPSPGRLFLHDRFPEEELPPSDGSGHLLTVVFFEPQFMQQPQLKTLFLPPSGPSLPCAFQFCVDDHAAEVEARVTVLHQNRVLQTGLLRGPVKPIGPDGLAERSYRQTIGWPSSADVIDPDQKPEPAPRIEFVVSGAVHRAVADLDLRSRFDAALVLNHVRQRPGLQAAAGNRSGYVWLDDVTMLETKKDIEEALDQADWDYDTYNGLTAEGTTKLLRLLAIKGSDIYVFLKKHFPPAVTEAQRLQVVMAKDNARFPIEFIYSLNPPAGDAPVCPHAAEALSSGACSQDCPATRDLPAPIVCPLGFWGFSRVIEWHAFTQEEALQLPANVAARLDIDTAPRSDEVALGGPCVFGYSKEIDKADQNCIPNFKEFTRKLPNPPVVVESWRQWKTAVQTLDPSLLMLLVHTQKGVSGTMLEMGPPDAAAPPNESLLAISYLSRDYVFGPRVAGSPILLLLGCTTGSAKLPFETVAAAFERRADAGIVVATTNLIYGPKAVELAKMFLEKLMRVQDGQTFGDVMLAVRRSALADGIPMVLCICAYGDADWKLVQYHGPGILDVPPPAERRTWNDGDYVYIDGLRLKINKDH